MAINIWRPQSIYRAQKVNVVAGGTISGETFTISIGGVVMATFVDVAGTADGVRDGLLASWNDASSEHYNHPYKARLSIAQNGTGTLLISALDAGVPFTLTLNTPGGSATFSQSSVQANKSPNYVGDTANWSRNVLPTTNDDVTIPAGTPDLLWGLGEITDTADDWHFEPGCGLIGLPAETFQVTPTSVNITVPEYRATFLTCKGSDHRIGAPLTSDQGISWPTRLKIDTSNVASNIVNRSTAPQLPTAAHPPVQIKCNQASTVIHNYGAAVGIAEDTESDTSTLGSVYNYEPTSRMRIGLGVTYANAEFDQGAKGILKSYPTTLLRKARGSVVDFQASGTIAAMRGPGEVVGKVSSVTVTAAQ